MTPIDGIVTTLGRKKVEYVLMFITFLSVKNIILFHGENKSVIT